ncbi:MAG: septum formation inhibitor Maf [Magnetococcales bacterium]|nr:septum formation inhibitor Maf [Magnetococcales bacterium]
MTSLVLASTSVYRRALLERLGLPFVARAPDVEEGRLPDETPEAMVRRLAEAKSLAVAGEFPGAVIIGSDQCAVIDGQVLGKPGDFAAAAAQLRLASGREVLFLTALCVAGPGPDRMQGAVIPFRVAFRALSEERIRNYLERERPFDCAGSFKSEGLGIALFARMSGDDPTALMGLPLIALTGMLEQAGVTVV